VVRIERVSVPELSRRVRIAWVSDLHLGRRTGIRTVRAVVLGVRRAAPDVIVIGGDSVDRTLGLHHLAVLVRALARVAPVWALPGNHDVSFGVTRIATTVRANGGAWLPGVVASVTGGAVSLIAGEAEVAGGPPAGVVVTCLHAPAAAARWRGRSRLAIAGHLHGGQIVLAEAFGRSWPCAFFFRWCGPRFELSGGTTLIVGAGAGDMLPVRWRCPREIVCVDLVPARESRDNRAIHPVFMPPSSTLHPAEAG
jgi:predicted MPP superfamily phosphohydrolase